MAWLRQRRVFLDNVVEARRLNCAGAGQSGAPGAALGAGTSRAPSAIAAPAESGVSKEAVAAEKPAVEKAPEVKEETRKLRRVPLSQRTVRSPKRRRTKPWVQQPRARLRLWNGLQSREGGLATYRNPCTPRLAHAVILPSA
eukprot:s225_g48.t1